MKNWMRICSLDELMQLKFSIFDIKGTSIGLTLIDGSVVSILNYCPHAGGPLNMLPDRFFSRDGYLMCTRHGAKFEARDGLCVAGPCTGDALNEFGFDH